MTYKQWVNGDILQAADQNALSLQTINRFADATARDAAISSPTEGMFVYLTGTNALQFYDGSSWTATSLTADITAIVTAASSGLAGGATSGDVTLTLNLAGVTAAQTFGADGSGVDVTLHSTTSGDLVLWDASDKALEFTDSKITMNDNLVETPEIKDYAETVNVIGSIGGGTQDIDITAGNVVTGTVDTSTTTFTFSNPSASGKGCSFTLILTNGGSQTVNWPGAVDWAGGTAPTLTTSGVDVLTFMTVDAGTIWYGVAAGLDMKYCRLVSRHGRSSPQQAVIP